MALLSLILFSGIGFNIITTFCGGCDDEHVEVAVFSVNDEKECSCCSSMANEASCCSSPNHEHDENQHHSSSKFAKIDYEVTESKAGKLTVIVPVLDLPYLITVFSIVSTPTTSFDVECVQFTPLEWGKSLLNHICVLRL
ncbi:MAG TPA: hypothetical protein PLS94_03070 [Prolixibacteraceae bacterium]|nr:hypothetical protein [Prolixibacteraceae bacterium]